MNRLDKHKEAEKYFQELKRKFRDWIFELTKKYQRNYIDYYRDERKILRN